VVKQKKFPWGRKSKRDKIGRTGLEGVWQKREKGKDEARGRGQVGLFGQHGGARESWRDRMMI